MAQKNRIQVIGLFNYQPTCFSQRLAAAILLVVLLVSNRARAENIGAVLQQAVAAHMIGVVPGHQKEKLFPKEDVTKKVFDDHSADFVKRFGTFVQWDGAAKDLAETKSPVHLIRVTCVTETIDPKTGKATQWTRFRANVHLDNREEQKILNFRPLYEDGHIMNATGRFIGSPTGRGLIYSTRIPENDPNGTVSWFRFALRKMRDSGRWGLPLSEGQPPE